MSQQLDCDIAIIGGSGVYNLAGEGVELVTELHPETPYGKISSSIVIYQIGQRRVSFIPRHGTEHRYPAHEVNYRANVWALGQLKVKAIIGLCCVGSLKEDIRPGDLVCCDDFANFTNSRLDTFGTQGSFQCLNMGQPYCPHLRRLTISSCLELHMNIHSEKCSVAVINGPRLSTYAESRFYSAIGHSVVNMTQYPECYLAKELSIPYVMLGLVTDYDISVPNHESSDLAGMLACIEEHGWKLKSVALHITTNYVHTK